MLVKVIQFLMPNGKQKPLDVSIDDRCQEKYKAILNLGGRLTAEMVRTREVSQTIEFPAYDSFDYDIVLTNGRGVVKTIEALEKMIMRFDPVACKAAMEKGFLVTCKTIKEIVTEIAPTMQCNCDLDNWQPEASTGHSWVCRIHKAAVDRCRADYKAKCKEDRRAGKWK